MSNTGEIPENMVMLSWKIYLFGW